MHLLSPVDDYTPRLTDLGCFHHEVPYARTFAGIFDEVKTVLLIRSLCLKVKPKYLFSFTAKANVACGLLLPHGIRFVPNVSGFGDLLNDSGQLKFQYRLILKVSLRRAERIFAQNNRDKKIIEGLRLSPAVLIKKLPGSGVLLTNLPPITNANQTVSSFAMITRLHVKKGVREYAAAAAIMKKEAPLLQFFLAGFSPEKGREWLTSEEVDEMHQSGSIIFCGRLSSSYDLLPKIDCFVLPSYYNEGTPRSLIEAGSLGVPAITTKSAGCDEIIADGHNGILVEPKSVTSLVEAMRKMTELSASALQLMRRRAATHVREHYGVDRVVSEYLEIISGKSNR